MKKQNGLAKQFMGMIALAALESVLLLTVSQVVLAKGLRFWFSRTEVQQHATQKQVQELQSYVTEHHLASTDVKELTDWSHKRRYTLLELYRGQTMIYSSFAPKDGMISFLPQNVLRRARAAWANDYRAKAGSVWVCLCDVLQNGACGLGSGVIQSMRKCAV